MSKEKKRMAEPELSAEYDFRKGVRGKYAQPYTAGSNIVVLSPDLARVFPDSESVYKALRALVEIAQQSAKISG